MLKDITDELQERLQKTRSQPGNGGPEIAAPNPPADGRNDATPPKAKESYEAKSRPVWEYPKNDLGNARALADRIHQKSMFCPETGIWFLFDERWKSDSKGTLRVVASQMIDEQLRLAFAVEGDEARRWAIKRMLWMGYLRTMKDMIELTQNDPRIVVPLNELDADPWVLGVENGILDLRTKQLVPDPHLRKVTRSLGTRFKAGARCPTWEAFIERVTRDYEGLAGFLKRSVGYSLTGLSTQHVYWFLHGGGRNGKTTFVEALQALSGEYGTRASDRLLAVTRNGSDAPLDELADLPGVRFLFGSETQEGVQLNEKLVKDLTGGDTLRARHLYRKGFNFRPVCKLWMFGNHRPNIAGSDQGMWRRTHLVPFTAKITEQESDPHLPERIRRELTGILNWALEGLQEWRDIGLCAPPCVVDATAEYRSEQDALGDFITDCVHEIPGFTVSKTDLYDRYLRWCQTNGQRYPWSSKRLSQRLKAKGFVETGSREWRDCSLK